MIKRVLVIMICLLLVGCNSDYEAVIDELKDNNLSLQGELSELKADMEVLSDTVAVLTIENKQLIEKASESDRLSALITRNQELIASQDIMIEYLYSKIDFANSLANSFDGYHVIAGYITDIDIENHKLYIDECEFLGLEDVERLTELGLDPDKDLPSAFYIHNPDETPVAYDINEFTRYIKYTYYEEYAEELIGQLEFMNRIPEYHRFYMIKVMNGTVLEAAEYYTP